MGTRGIMGFRVKGKDYLTYNHFDSYPSSLGVAMAKFARAVADDPKGYAKKVAALVLVKEGKKPTASQIRKLKDGKYADFGVSSGQANDWYCLLRRTQGDPEAVLDCGFLIDSREFMRDGLFCEWAYVVNFDEEVLEVYRGFMTGPHDKGRYARLKPRKLNIDTQYYPVALIGTFKFADASDEAVLALETLKENSDG